MKFQLVDGKVEFLTHKVEWQVIRNIKNSVGDTVVSSEDKKFEFYDVGKKDALLAHLAEREITPTVTEIAQPSAEIKAMCEGKTFNSYKDALEFIETGAIPLTETETLALAITELYEMMSGGDS